MHVCRHHSQALPLRRSVALPPLALCVALCVVFGVAPTRSRRVAAFTLVEMLVTVALIAVLMLSVTQIFSIATRTISGGQAIGAAVRDAQAAQAVMSRDLSAAVSAAEEPCFVIRMKQLFAFRNQADAISDADQNPATYDSDGDGTEETTVPTLTYNFRNHRLDYLTFFARDRFPRQTGGGSPLSPASDPLIANQTANEAAIYMHQLAVTDNAGGFMAPGAGTILTNPNNFYASQWTLGRMAVLLVKPDASSNIYDLSGAPQTYFPQGVAPTLTPLSSGTAAGSTTLNSARLDLAGTTVSAYSATLSGYISNAAGGALPWAQGTAYLAMPVTKVIVGGSIYQVAANHIASAANKPPNAAFWTRSAAALNWYTPLMCDNRFQVNPFVTKPITAATASQQVPIFLPACTQFIVEFAGDFVTQNPVTGAVTAAVPDNQIDYVPGTSQIRWYGLPRDTDGDGAIIANKGDVVPVCDIARQAMPFEHFWPVTGATAPAATPNATGTHSPIMSTDSNYLANLPANTEYTVAWGPGDTDRPKLIRITIVIDRPEAAGNLIDGQTFEYVFKVGL